MANTGLTITQAVRRTLPPRACHHSECEKRKRSYCKALYNRIRYAMLSALGLEPNLKKPETVERKRMNNKQYKREQNKRYIERFGGVPSMCFPARMRWLEAKAEKRDN